MHMPFCSWLSEEQKFTPEENVKSLFTEKKHTRVVLLHHHEGGHFKIY